MPPSHHASDAWAAWGFGISPGAFFVLDWNPNPTERDGAMLLDFGLVLALILGSLLAAGLLLGLSARLRPRRPTAEKAVVYECGEDPVGSGRVQYNNRFYVTAVVFLLFDVEVVFLYPVVRVFREWTAAGRGTYALVELLLFVGILFGGLVYVWGKGKDGYAY